MADGPPCDWLNTSTGGGGGGRGGGGDLTIGQINRTTEGKVRTIVPLW